MRVLGGWTFTTWVVSSFLLVGTSGAQDSPGFELSGSDVPKHIVIHAFFKVIQGDLADPEELGSALARIGISPESAEAEALLREIERFRSMESHAETRMPAASEFDEQSWSRYQGDRHLDRVGNLAASYGRFLLAVEEESSRGRAEAIDRLIVAVYGEMVTFTGDGDLPPELFRQAEESFDQSLSRLLRSDARGIRDEI